MLSALLNMPDASLAGVGTSLAGGSTNVLDSSNPVASIGIAVAAAGIAGLLLAPIDMIRTRYDPSHRKVKSQANTLQTHPHTRLRWPTSSSPLSPCPAISSLPDLVTANNTPSLDSPTIPVNKHTSSPPFFSSH